MFGEKSAHGAGTGDAPLCGAGMNPHFLFDASKRKRPFTVKRKDALAQNGTSWCLFCLNTGVSVVGAAVILGVVLECAGGRRNRDGSSRIWRIGRCFRGRSPQGFYHQPRAFRFATRYRGGSGSGSGRRSTAHAYTTPESTSRVPNAALTVCVFPGSDALGRSLSGSGNSV